MPVAFAMSPGRQVHRASEFPRELAMVSEPHCLGNGRDGVVGFAQQLAGFADPERPHLRGGRHLNSLLKCRRKLLGDIPVSPTICPFFARSGIFGVTSESGRLG